MMLHLREIFVDLSRAQRCKMSNILLKAQMTKVLNENRDTKNNLMN